MYPDEISVSLRTNKIGLFRISIITLYEDGDLSTSQKWGVGKVLGRQIFVRAQIALKVSEIESMGSCGSILMSNFFSESI